MFQRKIIKNYLPSCKPELTGINKGRSDKKKQSHLFNLLSHIEQFGISNRCAIEMDPFKDCLFEWRCNFVFRKTILVTTNIN